MHPAMKRPWSPGLSRFHGKYHFPGHWIIPPHRLCYENAGSGSPDKTGHLVRIGTSVIRSGDPGFTGAIARRWQPGRPVRAQAVLPYRPGHLRCRVDRRCLLGFRGSSDRMSSRHGGRRSFDHPLVAVDHQRRVPRPRGAGASHRCWGGTIGLGIAIGPIAGGLLLAKFWWGSIFLVNVPSSSWRSWEQWCWCRTRRTRLPSGPIQSGRCCRSRVGPVTVGDHRGSDKGLDLRSRGRCRVGQLGRSGLLRRLGSPLSPPDAETGVLSERRFSIAAAAECLGAFGLMGALFLQTQFLQFDLGNSPLEAGLRILPMAGMLVVSAAMSPSPCPRHRGQVHRRRRAGGNRGRLVADLGDIHGCHDLWRRDTRSVSDRPWGRSPVVNGDELGRRLGPPRRLRNGVSDQCRGPPGRRRAWSRRHR